MHAEDPIRRVVGVSLNAAIDRIVSVPRLEPGRIHRPEQRAVVPGGKAANTVRAARHLGLPGALVAVLGGHAGAWYADAVAAFGIPLHAVHVRSETRTCLSILDEEAGTLTELYEAGVTLRPDDWPMIEVALAEALADDPGGARIAVVKLGAAGALAVGADGALVRAEARPTDAVDTTGAGDSFDAGFIAARMEGRPVDDALAFAVACGSLSTRAAGGTDGQATRDEVEAWLREGGHAR